MFMGKVVDIESQPRRRRSRKRPSKTALVLGGGGFTGGVYEIGALRALDLLAVNSTVNNFDVYVGTSAGSFVAAMLANGVTPDEMMQVINRRIPSELEDLDLGKVLRPNYLGFLEKSAMLPLRTLELARRGPGRRLPPTRQRALPDCHRSRHLRANRFRRGGLERRAGLQGDPVLHRAADRLQAR
jgi:hypothetical protein